jgi:hypothetical protein
MVIGWALVRRVLSFDDFNSIIFHDFLILSRITKNMWFAIALCAIIQTACGLNVVSDCGAKGDGKTDDTDSIQKCILQAFQVSTSSEISFPSGEVRPT